MIKTKSIEQLRESSAFEKEMCRPDPGTAHWTLTVATGLPHERKYREHNNQQWRSQNNHGTYPPFMLYAAFQNTKGRANQCQRQEQKQSACHQQAANHGWQCQKEQKDGSALCQSPGDRKS
jgi:hypothetical protein